MQSKIVLYISRYSNMFPVYFNPLTANDELSRHENLTFLWTWTLRYLGASRPMLLCVILCPLLNVQKTVKILAVKGLNLFNICSVINVRITSIMRLVCPLFIYLIIFYLFLYIPYLTLDSQNSYYTNKYPHSITRH